ncbi:MAG: GNAT family N-acetyltransferase [Neisseria sp.]|nr:GNAT family N-acetyltransferase [Neisseria sp.]
MAPTHCPFLSDGLYCRHHNPFSHFRPKERFMLNIRHQADQQRFALILDDEEIGYLDYKVVGGSWDITETRVSPSARGQGLGRRLVDAALKEADKQGIPVSASCDYAEEILAREGRL